MGKCIVRIAFELKLLFEINVA